MPALVWQRLSALGFEEAVGTGWGHTSLGHCAAAALSNGFLRMPSLPEELDGPAFLSSGKRLAVKDATYCGCSHKLYPTLRQLLLQPDYAGTDYECGLRNATLACVEPGCKGRAYVTRLCEGKPVGDDGKSHNHCVECTGLGKCIYDYRSQHCRRCKDHFFGGFVRAYTGQCRGGGEEGTGSEDEDDWESSEEGSSEGEEESGSVGTGGANGADGGGAGAGGAGDSNAAAEGSAPPPSKMQLT